VVMLHIRYAIDCFSVRLSPWRLFFFSLFSKLSKLYAWVLGLELALWLLVLCNVTVSVKVSFRVSIRLGLRLQLGLGLIFYFYFVSAKPVAAGILAAK